MAQGLSLTLSLSRKVNLGNYESIELFVAVGGITPYTTDEEIDNLLEDQGRVAYGKIANVLKARAAKAKEELL